MDNKVKIISNNVRGLQSYQKRRKLFHHFNTVPEIDIIMLQETHSTEKSENQWRAEWGGQAYFSHGTSEARGVCILIKNNVDFELKNITKDKEGRFLQISGTLQDRSMSIANIYGPNKDDILFFSYIQEKTEAEETDFSIIGGDFNCILDNDLDKKGGATRHANRRNQDFVLTWMEENSLIDIWRQMHPNLNRYTYHQQRPSKSFTRLDFFLISQGLAGFVDASSIQPAYCTDHSMITLSLNLLNHPRGRGFWKLNSTLLQDPEYVTRIKTTIRETEEQNSTANKQTLWELVKYQMRQETIKHASLKKKKTNNKLKTLEETLHRLDALRDESGTEEEEAVKIRDEIEKIQEEKTKGAMIRCKARWYEEGEKSTNYFLILENRNYSKKVIARLKDRHNRICTQPEDIRKELKIYYEKLYSSQLKGNETPDDSNMFLSTINKKLTNEESHQLEGPITEAEILAALKSTQNGKSPGSDGFNCEFYKFFWNDIKHLLKNSINSAYLTGEMSTSQKHGIITLLPNIGKDPLQLKNWRPISLLNLDYKLMAKCIALRIKRHLTRLIHSDQTGFIKGRYIGENINRILSIMELTEKENIPTIIACIDFEKAFDSLEWNFILKALESFNFGPSIIQWVKTLYKNPESCVLNNGWTTRAFKLERGVRQGCPLSPYLFILAAEALSCYIRSNGNIQGITINGTENKICQFADDTCLILKLDIESINAAFSAFEKFQKISGLKVNFDKTELFPAGTIKESNLPLYSYRNIAWSPHGVKILGIHISHNKKHMIDQNYNPILTKLENITNIWKRRNLTLYGKVAIIKAHLQSQLVYQLSVLPSPPPSFLKRVQKTLFKYLWNNKPDKIKRTVIHNIREDGGLAMPNIELQNAAIKITWIQRLLNNPECGWTACAQNSFPKRDFNILKGNMSPRDLQQNNLLPSSQFWEEVTKLWATYSYKTMEEINEEEMNDQPLWYNSHIKVRNQVLYYKHWQEMGIAKIKDLKDEFGNILNHQQLCGKFNIEANFLKYYSLISAIPRPWATNRRVMASPINQIESIIKAQKPSKLIYKSLLKQTATFPRNLTQKWERELSQDITTDILKKSFKMLYLSSTSTKIRSFQYRILHRCLGINSKLYEWGIRETNLCDICKKEAETYSHLFYTCEKAQDLWSGVKEWTQLKMGLQLEICSKTVIFGTNSPVQNLILNCTKLYIYFCKMSKTEPRQETLNRRIEEIKKTEKYIAIKNNKLQSFEKKMERKTRRSMN